MDQSDEAVNKNPEDDVIGEKVVPSSNRGDEGIMEGVTIGEGDEEEIENGHISSESDEGEEGIVIHAGRTTSQRRPARKSFSKSYTRPDALSPMTPHGIDKSSKDHQQDNEEDELKKLRFLRHVTAFDVDINALEDHPWRSKTVDLLDYFNYGFNERTWMQYCEKQLRLRSEKGLGPYVAPPVTTGAPLPTAAPGSSAPLAPVAPLPIPVNAVTVPSNVAAAPAAPPTGAPTTTPATGFLPPPPPPLPLPLGSFPANTAIVSSLDGVDKQAISQPMPPMPPMPFPGMNPQYGMMMAGPGQFGMSGGYPGQQGGWMGHHHTEELGRDMYGRERGTGREGDENPRNGPSKRKFDGDADTSNTRRRMASNSRDRGPPGRVRDGGTRDPVGRDGSTRDPFGRDGGTREPSGRDGGTRDPSGREGAKRDPVGRDGIARDTSGRDGGARDRDVAARDAGARGGRNSRDREATGRGRERDRDKERDRVKDREKDRGNSRDGRDRAGKEKDSRENEARRGDGSRRGGGDRERSKDRRENRDRDRDAAGTRTGGDTRDRGKGRDRERSADRRGRR